MIGIPKIFFDPSIEERFRRDGWVVLPLLEQEIVHALLDAYDGLHPQAASGFHATMYSSDAGYRRGVKDCIETFVAPLLTKHVRGHRLCVANFVVKEGDGRASEVAFHQDWSFVDEQQFRSIHVWCPLVDTTRENGCLRIFPGTHRYGNPARAHSDPHPFGSVLAALQEGCEHEEPTQAGHALLYDGALLHGSPENQTSNRRVCIGCVLIPVEATLTHCFRVSPTEVERFAVDAEFFLHHLPGSRPVGYPQLGTVVSEVRDLTHEEIAPLLNRGEGHDNG